MAKTYPTVMVNGILESGKTTFILDSLINGDFGDIGRALILNLEEGEVEYDVEKLTKCNAKVYTFESQEDFTVEKINSLIKENKPQVVFIEMNVMWDWEQFKLPPYLLVEQAFTIIDFNSFPIYFKNMRAMFDKMIMASDIVIMNRCKECKELAGYKRSMKVINNQATFILLDENGEQVHLVEDLPYKLGDEMIIKDEDFGVFYIDTFDSPNRYNGKIVEFNCMSVLSDELPPKSFVAGRKAYTCCADDIQLIGHLCAYRDPLFHFENRGWIHLRARVHYLQEGNMPEPQIVLEALSYKKIEEIENPIIDVR